ncbi:hypothetical protein KSP40_PGU014882 [Platanthera guangdongensis]|uniref:AMMECR1 domain-containing protein n=1 Tax=Platanthera guangdongensis TaxID=2320717 RepID=A0ABR2MM98_9ASPA
MEVHGSSVGLSISIVVGNDEVDQIEGRCRQWRMMQLGFLIEPDLICMLNHALRDRRFPPVQAKELPYLECTVSLLTEYESALNYLDWEIGKHGLIIEFTDPDYNTRRNGTYLPEVAANEELWLDVRFVRCCIPSVERVVMKCDVAA